MVFKYDSFDQTCEPKVNHSMNKKIKKEMDESYDFE